MRKERIEKEKETVELMIWLYCTKKERHNKLCPECRSLLEYAHARLNRCPYGNTKKSCKSCPVHCYKPALREKMRQVMRFSGPRMLLYAPLIVLRHLFEK